MSMVLKAFLVILLTPQITCNTPLSDYLWNSSEATRAYSVQDAVYFFHVKKSLDTAADRTEDEDLKAFLSERSKSYEKYFKEASGIWHINDPEGIVLGTACQNYVNHLKDVATTMDGYYLVVALTPCVRLWPWIGGQIGVQSKPFGVYTDWAKNNLSPDYKGYMKYEAVFNKAYLEQKITQAESLNVYKTSMASEVAFFNTGPGPVAESDRHDEL
ncbi:uncharacterized protein LOC123534952 isoform X2 [Mercenaria mercenaria]|uniref:uncharacterized protein LOC123534952 isoform X2 n=1 Tax=Mercenaria mercenaria TaxID=6596 RepID=UPI00234F5BA3|nr:uncharacterized protein LOC123534952 isoform X2 [Mercenaria mercenaria]